MFRFLLLASVSGPIATASLPVHAFAAQDKVQTDRLSGLSATALFDIAAQADAAGQIADAEAIYRALGNDPDAEIRAEARFRLGQMLVRQGRLQDAALAYRALLDEKPDAGRVRLELAAIHARLGDMTAAARELRQAQATGLPEDVAQIVDQFTTALRSTRRFGGSIELAFAPDTNINRATGSATLDTIIAPLQLDDDARAQSGVGIKLGSQIYARLPVESRVNLLARLSANGMFYDRARFNDASTAIQLGPEIQGPRDRVHPSLNLGWRHYGGDLYATTAGVGVEWRRAIGQRTQGQFNLSATDADYRINDLQDGMLYAASLGVERAIGARSGIGVTLSGDRQDAADPGYATSAGGVSLLGWREMGATTLYASAAFRRLEADARLFLYPERRRDSHYRLGVGAALRNLGAFGLAPVARVNWERNASTVGLYDYRRLGFELGVTRAF